MGPQYSEHPWDTGLTNLDFLGPVFCAMAAALGPRPSVQRCGRSGSASRQGWASPVWFAAALPGEAGVGVQAREVDVDDGES